MTIYQRLWILLLLPFSAQADYYEMSPEYFQTSDNFYFSRLRMDYSGFKSDTWWPYVNEPENGAGWTAHANILQADTPLENIASYALQLGIHNKRSQRNSWTLKLGVIQISEKTRDEYLDATFYLQSKGSWTDNSWYSIEAYKDYLLMERLVLSGQQHQLRAYGIKPSFLYSGWSRQRIFYRGHYSQMDHDNLSTNSDLQWMYGISQYQPWFWVGLGVNHITYSEQRNGYWSPEEFVSYGPRSEISANYGNFQFSAGFNYSFHKEKGFDGGEGYYSTASVQYGRRESNHVRLTGTGMESAQGRNEWRASSIQLSTLVQF